MKGAKADAHRNTAPAEEARPEPQSIPGRSNPGIPDSVPTAGKGSGKSGVRIPVRTPDDRRQSRVRRSKAAPKAASPRAEAGHKFASAPIIDQYRDGEPTIDPGDYEAKRYARDVRLTERDGNILDNPHGQYGVADDLAESWPRLVFVAAVAAITIVGVATGLLDRGDAGLIGLATSAGLVAGTRLRGAGL